MVALTDIYILNVHSFVHCYALAIGIGGMAFLTGWTKV